MTVHNPSFLGIRPSFRFGSPGRIFWLTLLFLTSHAALPLVAKADAEDASAPEVFAFLDTHCLACHEGAFPEADLDLGRFETVASIADESPTWRKVISRVRAGEMPPEGGEAPSLSDREAFVERIEQALRSAACDDGISPGPAPIRRLNRTEYANTIRDLLGIQIDAGHALPSDGAGGEGFDNAAETLFLSPIHAEKYLEAAEQALDYAFKDPRSRRRFLMAEPDEETTPEEEARRVLKALLPRAFRRPSDDEELQRYLALFREAQKRGAPFDEALAFAMRGVLVSPHFLFRLEEPNPEPEPRPVDDYALASRLSYFLWASMPDQTLFELAEQGRLSDPETLREQVVRMLQDRKARSFAESFVEQWLGTRDLGQTIQPDRAINPRYSKELESAFKYEPVLFFQEIFAENLSLLNILDADFTFLNTALARYYRIEEPDGLRQQLERVELPEDSPRGGVLGMASVLTVTSYPHRTSPVLRGAWVLETLLGAPTPPPPPNVPELEEPAEGEPPRTVRERLMQHRQNPNCASCHDRIDPIGFGLENYDVLGRWREEDEGLAIDSSGQLPDGSTFDGPEELKALLLKRKDDFARHLTTKMLGYALGRGLTDEDYCTVDQIVRRLQDDGYRARTLILEIVRSVPFRYQRGTDPTAALALDPSDHSHGQETSP